MKYSKFLVSTLVAAAAMTAPAFADDLSVTTDTTLTSDAAYGTIALENSGNLTIGNDSSSPNLSAERLLVHDETTTDKEVLTVNSGTLEITSTSTAQDSTAGVVIGHWPSGSGTLTVNGGTVNAKSSFTVVSWNSPGTLNINGGTYNAYGIQLAGTDTWNTRLNTAVLTLSSGRLNVGAGGILDDSGNSQNNKTFTFSGGTLGALSDSWSSSLAITLSGEGEKTIDTTKADSSEGSTITLSGAISGAGTLKIVGAGTVALTGSVSGGNLSVDSGATLDLSGGTLALAGAISNAGTVTISSSTVFDLIGFTQSESGVYTVISGNGSVSGWDALSKDSLRIDGETLAGRQTADFSTAGAVTVSGAAANLVWNGGETGTWNTSSENWTNNGSTDHFYTKDNVEFSTSGASITLGESVSAGTVKISENTTLTASSANTFSAKALTVKSGKTLTLGGSIGNYSWSSATLESDSVMDLGSGGEAIGSNASPLSISGTGTLKYAFSSNSEGGTGSGLYIADGFSGTVDYTGCLNWDASTNAGGANATLKLSARTDHTDDALWGTSAITLNSKIELGTDYGINLGRSGLTLTGAFSAQGKTLTVTNSNSNSNTLALAGEVNIGTLKIDGGIVRLGNHKENSTAALNIAKAEVTGTLSFCHWDATLDGAFSFAEGSTLLLADAFSDYTGDSTYSTSGKVSLTISGGVTLGGTMNYQSPYWKATEISGKITGTGGIDFNGTKDSVWGSGNNAYLILSNSENDFSGGITITRDTGVVRATSGGALGTGTVNISASSGILSYARTAAADGSYDEIANKITGSGTVKIDSGSVSLSGEVSEFSGAVSVASGAKLAVAADGDTVALNLSAASGISFAFGAKLLIDLSGVDASSATAEEIMLNLISSNSISFGNTALTAENISTVLTSDSYELIGLKSGWEFQSFGYNDNTLFATIAIPEPSAFGLLAGAGALALVAARRRRRSRAK